MDKNKLQLLANMALVRTRIDAIISVGRSTIPVNKLHAVQNKARLIDVEFVDLLLSESNPESEKSDAAMIADAVNKAKQDLAAKSGKVIKTSLEGTSVVVNPPDDEEEEDPKPVKVRKAKVKVGKE
jgi:hypothetical protein